MSENDRRAAIASFVERAHAALDRVDYYRLLGVSSAADEQTIRAAYYKLAASLHPDIHGLEVDPTYRAKLTTVFSRVVEAYKVLSDKGLRDRYDRQLAGGNLRMSMGVEVEPARPEIADANALRFYKLGLTALETGDTKAALMNFRLALSVAPDNAVIKAAIARAQGEERP